MDKLPQIAADVTIHSPDMHKMLQLMEQSVIPQVAKAAWLAGLQSGLVWGVLAVALAWIFSLSRKVNR